MASFFGTKADRDINNLFRKRSESDDFISERHCCFFHRLMRYAFDRKDFYLRCLHLYDGHHGTTQAIPTCEVFMLCNKMLFMVLEPVGVRELVTEALDCSAEDIEEFYAFTNFTLHLKVLFSLNKVVGDRLAAACGDEPAKKFSAEELGRPFEDLPEPIRFEDWSEEEVRAREKESPFLPNADFLLWLSVKKVTSFLLDFYRWHSEYNYPRVLRGFRYMSQLLGAAVKHNVPKRPDGQLALLELEPACIMLIHKLRTDDRLRQQSGDDTCNEALHAKYSYVEDYHFTKFFMDPKACAETPDTVAMVQRLRSFIERKELLNLTITDDSQRCTRLASGLVADQLSAADQKDVMWLNQFLVVEMSLQSYYEAPSKQLTKLLYFWKLDKYPEKNHAEVLSRLELKKVTVQLAKYQHNMPGTELIEVRRILDGIGFLVGDSRRLTDATHVKLDLLRVLLAVMKEAHDQRDWLTFALACLPLTLHNYAAANSVEVADRNGLLQMLCTSLQSDCDMAICQSCSTLSSFAMHESYLKRLSSKYDILSIMMQLLRKPTLSDNVVAQLCMLLPQVFTPSLIGTLEEKTANEYMVILHMILSNILMYNRHFDLLRFQVRPHEAIVKRFVPPTGEVKFPPGTRVCTSRGKEQVRAQVLMSLLSVLPYTFNVTQKTNKLFFEMDGVRLLHFGMKEREKSVISMALKACAALLRAGTTAYRRPCMKIPGFPGDVARIYCKYKSEALEVPAVDILHSLCSPHGTLQDREIWGSWLDSKHTLDKLVPKLMRQALVVKPLTYPTFCLAVLTLLVYQGKEGMYVAIAREMGIFKISRQIFNITIKYHGQRRSQELAHFCMRFVVKGISRVPELLEQAAAPELFSGVLSYSGLAYPTDHSTFKLLDPVWRGNGFVDWKRSDGSGMHEIDVDKAQRDETMSSALCVLELIMSLADQTSTSFYATKIMDSGYVECIERVLIKTSINFGSQLVKKNRLLDNVDNHSQWGWYEVMRHCKIIRHICTKEVAALCLSFFLNKPTALNGIHNLLLIGRDTNLEWEDIRDLVDTLMIMVSVAMQIHFGESGLAPQKSTSWLIQMLDSRQNMFRNRWKGEMLLDTIFDLYEPTLDTVAHAAVGRFLESLNTCTAEDYKLAPIVESTESFRRAAKAGKQVPIVLMDMVTNQSAYAQGKLSPDKWVKPVTTSFKSLDQLPAHIHGSRKEHPNVSQMSASDGQNRFGTAHAAMTADKVWSFEMDRLLQESRQKILGQLEMDEIAVLQLKKLETGVESIFELPELKSKLDRELLNHGPSPAMSRLANLELSLRQERDRLDVTGDGKLDDDTMDKVLTAEQEGKMPDAGFDTVVALAAHMSSEEEFPKKMTQALLKEPEKIDITMIADLAKMADRASPLELAKAKDIARLITASRAPDPEPEPSLAAPKASNPAIVGTRQDGSPPEAAGTVAPLAATSTNGGKSNGIGSNTARVTTNKAPESGASVAKVAGQANGHDTGVGSVPAAGSVSASVIDNDSESGDGKKRQQLCDECGQKMAKVKRCARCRKVRYCSRECQRLAWKDHRAVCEDAL